jgi:hypothetical protein
MAANAHAAIQRIQWFGVGIPRALYGLRKEAQMPRQNRSARTGKFVTAAYAKKHGATTVSEARSKKRKKR